MDEHGTVWFSPLVREVVLGIVLDPRSLCSIELRFSLQLFFRKSPEKSKLANPEASTSSGQSWPMAAGSLLLLLLIAAHVIALVYWVFRLATEKQPQRTKRH
ncbi:unnamed protein product [Cuscuta campestris]|uniref:Uncharacterized protein n=1 Tax=Cuscuta campestris TaxID=132261 RepID=A0A484KZ01_9ASTE|nr:unnamed protein product [Cuscuta campestris]